MSDYRDAPATCPLCQEPMEQRVLSGATVDTCATCRGLWVDWFDGELLAVVKETAPLSFRPAIAIDPERARCPRCTQPLIPETFAESTVLLRCSDCAGCFVPRDAFNALLDLDLPAHSRHGVDAEKQTAFVRLLAAIQKLFGSEVTQKITLEE